MDPEDLLARTSRSFLSTPSVRAALLFGSRLTGRARSGSDVDIAVLLDAGAATALRKPVLWVLYAALGKELPSERLDLLILNDAPPKLAWRVLKEGRVAFERDPIDLHRFRVRTYSRHADLQHVERFLLTASQQKLATVTRA
ncbi:MAG TPA: nucleotidyltransferase domain-containing protein [Polyangiaceae bacterium]|nr:nucleotidyltransferase domain-containing protein [Polyangiaceae bacterium]